MEDKSMKTPENNIRSILKCTNYEPKRRKVAFASDDDEANSDASSDVMEVEVSDESSCSTFPRKLFTGNRRVLSQCMDACI